MPGHKQPDQTFRLSLFLCETVGTLLAYSHFHIVYRSLALVINRVAIRNNTLLLVCTPVFTSINSLGVIATTPVWRNSGTT